MPSTCSHFRSKQQTLPRGNKSRRRQKKKQLLPLFIFKVIQPAVTHARTHARRSAFANITLWNVVVAFAVTTTTTTTTETKTKAASTLAELSDPPSRRLLGTQSRLCSCCTPNSALLGLVAAAAGDNCCIANSIFNSFVSQVL